MAVYRGLLELDPNNADAHNMLGNAFADLKQWPEAAECYRQAVAVDPEKAAAHYNLGNALSALGLLEDAAACYRRAIKLKPQYAAAHFNLGNVLYDLERWEDATAAFRQALDADLSHPDLDAAFNLARSLHRAGRLDEAVAYYRQVVQDKPEFHDAYGALSSALLEAGRPQEALDWHRRALDRNPDEPAAHFYLSRTLLMLGQLEAAEAALRRVLELDPRSGDAYRTLGRVLESLDKREELAALAEQWVQASPDDPQAAHFRAAWTGQQVPPRTSDDHVRQTFDGFAAEFDEALGHLDYRAPQLLHAALHAAWGNAEASLEILDAGCGTGLCGPLLRPLAQASGRRRPFPWDARQGTGAKCLRRTDRSRVDRLSAALAACVRRDCRSRHAGLFWRPGTGDRRRGRRTSRPRDPGLYARTPQHRSGEGRIPS